MRLGRIDCGAAHGGDASEALLLFPIPRLPASDVRACGHTAVTMRL